VAACCEKGGRVHAAGEEDEEHGFACVRADRELGSRLFLHFSTMFDRSVRADQLLSSF
jgi:hypothetical protein